MKCSKFHHVVLVLVLFSAAVPANAQSAHNESPLGEHKSGSLGSEVGCASIGFFTGFYYHVRYFGNIPKADAITDRTQAECNEAHGNIAVAMQLRKMQAWSTAREGENVIRYLSEGGPAF